MRRCRRRTRAVVWNLLWALALLPCKAAISFTGYAPSAMIADSAGYSYLVFPTRPGYEYDVLKSDNLTEWELLSSHYGLGQGISMIVKYTPPAGAGGGNPPLPHDAYYSAFFYIHAFSGGSGNGKALVGFTHDGVRVNVLLQEDFSAIADLPLFAMGYVEESPDPANPGQTLSAKYSISASAMASVWQQEFAGPDYAVTALTQAQSEHLAILTDRIATVKADMLAAKNQQGAPPPLAEPPPSAGVANPRTFFLVEEWAPDSDGDGIPDAIELAFWNSSAFMADSDGDGVPDAWDAYPMDPTRWQFVPGDPNDSSAPILYLTAPTGAISQ